MPRFSIRPRRFPDRVPRQFPDHAVSILELIAKSCLNVTDNSVQFLALICGDGLVTCNSEFDSSFSLTPNFRMEFGHFRRGNCGTPSGVLCL
jgi:hypothetical protein